MFLLWMVLFLALFLVLAYQRASLVVSTIAIALYLVCFFFLSSVNHVTAIGYSLFVGALVVVLGIKQIRQLIFTKTIFELYQKLMPTMSRTEEEALNAGGVGWEAELFTGMPNWERLQAMPGPGLSEEEQAFIDGPLETLCQMLNSWEISRDRALPKEAWDFLKAHGFFGLIIPKSYGGKEFSAVGHSEIIAKAASFNLALATVISVPNSLGPAELLLRYGTEEQKNYYLPRLAQGLEIPCFALTSPVAGSDAASIVDHGVICRRFNNGVAEMGIRLNWNKRYITLAPIATILGLAFKLYDPEHLMGSKEDLGITCALIPTTTEGVQIGRRHLPLNAAFPNGPTQGEDVFIPLDWIIGGFDRAGQGWRMLMECLAAGRAISLPSLACGGAKKAALASGAYVRIRRQFNVPIEMFGGVEDALAQMAAGIYLLEATRLFTVSALDHGSPSAIGAGISKYHCTELAREVINGAMDVHGGKAICMGPHNYLAQGYIETPISITVEGANILTRSLIIFGQGAMRGHPYLFTEVQAANNKNLEAFDRAFFAHLWMIVSNFVRSFSLGLFVANPLMRLFKKVSATNVDNAIKRYQQSLNWLTAGFAFMADFSVITLGSKIKIKEKISGRLGDILSYLYMASAVLNFYRDSKNKPEELAVVEWVLKDLFFKIQSTFQALFQNVPYAKCLRFIIFPWGYSCKPACDAAGVPVAQLLSTPSELRRRLGQLSYLKSEPNNLVGIMNEVLGRMIVSEGLEHQLHQAVRKGAVQGLTRQEQIESALKANVLQAAEAKELLELDAIRMQVINVDDFSADLN